MRRITHKKISNYIKSEIIEEIKKILYDNDKELLSITLHHDNDTFIHASITFIEGKKLRKDIH